MLCIKQNKLKNTMHLRSVQVEKPLSSNTISKAKNDYRKSQNQSRSPFQNQSRRASQIPSHPFPDLKKHISDQQKSEQKGSRSRQRDHSLTPTNISEVETQFIRIEEILNQKNHTLQSQNAFLKQQIANLYDRQKKYREAFRKYKQKVKFLRLQKAVYQTRYEDLKSYVVEVMRKITEQNMSLQKTNQKKQCSQQLIGKLKQELQEIGMRPYSEAKVAMRQSEKYQKGSCFDGQYPRESEEVALAKSAQRHKKFCDENIKSTRIRLERFTDNPKVRSRLLNEKEPSIVNGCQGMLQPSKSVHPKKTFASSDVSEEQQSEKNGVSSNDVDQWAEENDKTQPLQIDAINLIDKSVELMQRQEKGIDEQIEQLTDESQALMYELRNSGNKSKEVKKKLVRISRRIKELEYEKQASSRLNELKINETSTDL